MRQTIKYLPGLLLLFIGIQPVGAQDSTKTVTGEITYISTDRVYGKPGTGAGLVLGDTLQVLRDDETIGRLVITAISTNSHSAQTVQATQEFAVGDAVQATITVKPAPQEPIVSRDVPADTTKSLESLADDMGKSVAQPPKKTAPFLKSSGSVTLRYYGIFNNKSLDTYHQPAALIRWRAKEITGKPLRFDFYGRAQKEFAGDLSQRAGNNARPFFRVYTAGFTYGERNSKVHWQAGRVYPRNVSGIGSVDGVLYGRKNNGFTYGVTAGFQPDYYDNRINTEILKTGAYTGWSNGRYGQGGYAGVLAFVGQYRTGNIDREYVTTRHAFNPTQYLRLSYVGDFSLDRADHSDQIGLITPSNSYFRFNWSRISWMRVSMRYNFRKSIRLFATQSSIPDSLYKYQNRQGVTGTIYFSLPWNIRLYVTQTYRTRTGGSKPVVRTSGSLYFRELFQTGVRMRTRYAHGSSEFSTTNDISVSLERRFWTNLTVQMSYEIYSYLLQGRADPIRRNTFGADFSYQFRTMYLSLRYDYYKDAGFRTQHISASLSTSF